QRLRIRLADRRRTLHHLVEQVLEVCAAPLERRRVHVREVVRDHFHAQLLRGHPARRGANRWIHRQYPRQETRPIWFAIVPFTLSTSFMVLCTAAWLRSTVIISTLVCSVSTLLSSSEPCSTRRISGATSSSTASVRNRLAPSWSTASRSAGATTRSVAIV